jgi:hypothetical protein
LRLRHRVNYVIGDSHHGHDVLVKDADAAGGDGPHRQLLLTGDSELADEEDVEWRAEGAGDLVGHRHPAARQTEDKHVGAVGVAAESPGEGAAGVGAVAKGHDRPPGH